MELIPTLPQVFVVNLGNNVVILYDEKSDTTRSDLVMTQIGNTILLRDIYMLFAGWEVCIVKNCDRGLENAAPGRNNLLFFFAPLISQIQGQNLTKALPWPVG